MARYVVGRDSEGRVIDIPVSGDKGMVGGSGGSGAPGDKGPTGDPGPQGPAGDKGPPGDKGATGTAGTAGAAGATGSAGAQGEAGVAGPAGTAGATGDKGPVGDKGPTGDKGAVGDKGATGDAGSGGQAFPVGSVYIAVIATNPAQTLGYGTWSALGAGRVLMGVDAGQSGEQTGGSATHSHAGHTDHGALTHSGATVANHTDILNHVHVQNINTATTGGAVGYPALKDTSTSGSEATGVSTANPTTVGTATMAHTVGQASQHAAQSHSAHDTASNLPPFLAVYIWKRTA